MNEILEQFEKHATAASIHYADDSCREWGHGNREKEAALAIFDENPELQSEMREIGKRQLWSLSSERPNVHTD